MLSFCLAWVRRNGSVIEITFTQGQGISFLCRVWAGIRWRDFFCFRVHPHPRFISWKKIATINYILLPLNNYQQKWHSSPTQGSSSWNYEMVGRLGDEATILGGGEMAQRTRRGCVFPAQSGREWFAEKVPKKRGWREICWSVIMPTWEALERGLLLFRGEGCIFFFNFLFCTGV